MSTESIRTLITALPGLLASLKPHATAGRHLVQHVRVMQREPVDPLARRAKLAAHIRACAESGKVALVHDGMDCDCVQYRYTSLRNAAPYVIEREISKAHDWADGPVSIYIAKPSEAPEGWSRDLALEAFEDGHPHVVYA